MSNYGWAFLIIAVVLGALNVGGFVGTYTFSATIVASLCLLLSLLAFVADKRTHAS